MLNNIINTLIDNTQLIRDMHLKMAGATIKNAPTHDAVLSNQWTVEQAERIILEQQLKDWYLDMVDCVKPRRSDYKARHPEPSTTNFLAEHEFRDMFVMALVAHAFGQIEFFELARQLLSDYRERHEQNN